MSINLREDDKSTFIRKLLVIIYHSFKYYTNVFQSKNYKLYRCYLLISYNNNTFLREINGRIRKNVVVFFTGIYTSLNQRKPAAT